MYSVLQIDITLLNFIHCLRDSLAFIILELLIVKQLTQKALSFLNDLFFIVIKYILTINNSDIVVHVYII